MRKCVVKALPSLSTVRFGASETPLGWAGIAWAGEFAVAFTLGKPSREAAFEALDRRIRALWGPHVHLSCEDSDASAYPIRAYFSKDFVPLDHVPVAIPFRSPFALAVFRTLRKTRPGETVTYRDLAGAVGHPFAARAVGSWMRRNPVPILIPCHRVVRADGSLGRYAEGDWLKAFLLQWEKQPEAKPRAAF
ncbi:MAG: methylated-DNA--[protein]-cysteine S-methyltransferase [Thermoguttaceae bacterium]|nr:methylated-DNA--[protein]-cysteine S-methyltransferase [Thermoguttaceae bacterium]MDW8079900.1 methylated-DNA--[protein]-cysteine S-methyltransferase [Thermoguttaceae bacterium]